MDKKKFILMTSFCVFALGFVVPFSSRINTFPTLIRKGISAPSDVEDYNRYYAINNVNTLIDGCDVYFTSGDNISTTSLDTSCYITKTNTFTDPFHIKKYGSYFGFYKDSTHYLQFKDTGNTYGFDYYSSLISKGYFTITIENKEATLNLNYDKYTRYVKYASGTGVFILSASENTITLKVDIHSVIKEWGNKYIIDGKCNDNFTDAKSKLLSMDNAVKYGLYHNLESDEDIASIKYKYEAWASSLGVDAYE